MLPAFFDENLHQQFAESFSSMSGRQVYCRFEGISVSRPLFPGMCIAVSHNFMVCFAYEKGKVGKNFCYTQAPGTSVAKAAVQIMDILLDEEE